MVPPACDWRPASQSGSARPSRKPCRSPRPLRVGQAWRQCSVSGVGGPGSAATQRAAAASHKAQPRVATGPCSSCDEPVLPAPQFGERLDAVGWLAAHACAQGGPHVRVRRPAGKDWQPVPRPACWAGWASTSRIAWASSERRRSAGLSGSTTAAKRPLSDGVLVPATHPGVAGQGRQARQSEASICAGLPSNSRPQPRLNRVSPQNNQAIAVEGDVAEGMAGDLEDVEGPVVDLDPVAVADPYGGSADALICRRDHRQIWPSFAAVQPVPPIWSGWWWVSRMATGSQAGLGRRQHRPGLARIDHQRATRVVGQRPDVVVGEGGQGFQMHAGTPIRLQSHTQSPRQSDHALARTSRQPDPSAGLVRQRRRAGAARGRGRGDGARARGLPALPWCWLGVPGAVPPDCRVDADAAGRDGGHACARHGIRFDGALRCGLPLPLASETFGAVLLQHALDDGIRAEPPAGRMRTHARAGRPAVAGRAESLESRTARAGRAPACVRTITGVWQAALRRAGFAQRFGQPAMAGAALAQWRTASRCRRGRPAARRRRAAACNKRVHALIPPAPLKQSALAGRSRSATGVRPSSCDGPRDRIAG